MLNSIDHIVLTVKDLDKTIAFYRDVLGVRSRIDREQSAACVNGQ